MWNDNWVLSGLFMTMIFFVIGLIFAAMGQKACGFIAGYNFKSKEERKKYDEERLAKDMRNFLFICSAIFLAGAIVTFILGSVGFWASFIIWLIYFFRNFHIDDEKAFGKYRK